MSRIAVGWVANATARDEQQDYDGADELPPSRQEIHVHQWPAIEEPFSHEAFFKPGIAPCSLQQHVDSSANEWANHWACDTDMPPCEWPTDLGPLPPQLEAHILRGVLASFPSGLGLGWDAIHPRALLRFGDFTLLAIVRMLFFCEVTGQWPNKSAAVIVALLPKTSPGLRPIGLFPLWPKVWAKIRRQEALRWEIANDRPYLYAGPGKGANVVAWKQAARAEHAASMPAPMAYGMTLLDLIKAFDSVPWHVLLREAIRLGFNLWILRLPIASYQAPRMIRISGVLSRPVCPRRSLAAGSGLATTEMRLIMINLVDAALAVAPQATPSLYVDDLSIEAAGTERFVVEVLPTFTNCVCQGIRDNLMQVSNTKSLCTASTFKLGADLQRRMCQFNIRFASRVTSLGSALGAGTRRNATVLKKRIGGFARRLPRFRRLAAAKVDTRRLLRTGGLAAVSYGQAITGVAPSTLLRQRRAAAAVAAPASGTCGQDLDLALLIADGGPKGRADPAYDAHLMLIGEWAEGVWHQRLPKAALRRMVAKAQAVLSAAVSPWQRVHGPAKAMVASAQRLRWEVLDAFTVRTDLGRTLVLTSDPPSCGQERSAPRGQEMA